MGLMGRINPLYLFGPPALIDIIDLQLSVANTTLPFEIHFTALKDNEAKLLVDTPHFSIQSFPVEHRIPCHGFVFTAKNNGRKIIPEKCREYEIPAAFYRHLKEGSDYIRKDGFEVKNEWVTEPGPKEKRYAYCADTRFTLSFLEYVKGADAIYHESTYLHDLKERAEERFHSTAQQAAEFAKAAGAGRLLLGHFSSKYVELDVFREEASKIFPDVEVSAEGMSYEI
jgi:ribonuclease Z